MAAKLFCVTIGGSVLEPGKPLAIASAMFE
jgi:hypothetical protein